MNAIHKIYSLHCPVFINAEIVEEMHLNKDRWDFVSYKSEGAKKDCGCEECLHHEGWVESYGYFDINGDMCYNWSVAPDEDQVFFICQRRRQAQSAKEACGCDECKQDLSREGPEYSITVQRVKYYNWGVESDVEKMFSICERRRQALEK